MRPRRADRRENSGEKGDGNGPGQLKYCTFPRKAVSFAIGQTGGFEREKM